MTKIVIPNTAQTGFFQHERKILCDEVRLDALTDLIHIDIIQKVRAIRAAADLAMFFLFRFQLMQQFLKRRNERQGAVTGFCLGAFLIHDGLLAVNIYLRHSMLDRQRFPLIINRIPP